MDTRTALLRQLAFTRQALEMLLKDFPEEHGCHQPAPTDNHVLWIVGHLAGTDEWLGSMFGLKPALPESWKDLFSYGTSPIADPAVYPSMAEVQRGFEGSRATLVAFLKSADESVLTTSLTEQSGGFMDDGLDAIGKLAWHEGWHSGQAASVRRSLGLPAVFG